jgi:hypothetical protein
MPVFTRFCQDSNIELALGVVADRDWQGAGDPLTLNLVGWSRGGLTCIRAAHWLQGLLDDTVRVNIFAVDPGPGGHLRLPSIVKNFVALVVGDGHRLDVQDGELTNVALLPMPRAHQRADVAQYLAYKFLTLNGTVFAASHACAHYDAVELSERYAQMMLQRDVNQPRGDYLSKSDKVFMNEHHVECFRAAFPTVFAALFPDAPPPSLPCVARTCNPQVADLVAAFAQLQQRSPATYQLLYDVKAVNAPAGPGDSWLYAPGAVWTPPGSATPRARQLLARLIG